MSVLGILLGYRLKRRKRRKRGVLKNPCEIFRDNNHLSLYKNMKLYNDIDWNPRPVYVNESTEYCYLKGLLSHEKKLALARLACLCLLQCIADNVSWTLPPAAIQRLAA